MDQCGHTWGHMDMRYAVWSELKASHWYAPDPAILEEGDHFVIDAWEGSEVLSDEEAMKLKSILTKAKPLHSVIITRCNKHKLSAATLHKLFLVEISKDEAVARYVMTQ